MNILSSKGQVIHYFELVTSFTTYICFKQSFIEGSKFLERFRDFQSIVAVCSLAQTIDSVRALRKPPFKELS